MSETTYWSRYWQRRLSRRRMLQGTVVGGAGLAAAVVIGCDEEESPSSPTATTPGGAAAEQPVQGGTFVYINQGTEALPHLDPQQNSFAVLHESGPAIVYSRLMGFDLDRYPGENRLQG